MHGSDAAETAPPRSIFFAPARCSRTIKNLRLTLQGADISPGSAKTVPRAPCTALCTIVAPPVRAEERSCQSLRNTLEAAARIAPAQVVATRFRRRHAHVAARSMAQRVERGYPDRARHACFRAGRSAGLRVSVHRQAGSTETFDRRISVSVARHRLLEPPTLTNVFMMGMANPPEPGHVSRCADSRHNLRLSSRANRVTSAGAGMEAAALECPWRWPFAACARTTRCATCGAGQSQDPCAICCACSRSSAAPRDFITSILHARRVKAARRTRASCCDARTVNANSPILQPFRHRFRRSGEIRSAASPSAVARRAHSDDAPHSRDDVDAARPVSGDVADRTGARAAGKLCADGARA